MLARHVLFLWLNLKRRFSNTEATCAVRLDTFQLNESDKSFAMERDSNIQRSVEYCQTIIKSSEPSNTERSLPRNELWPIYVRRIEKCNYEFLLCTVLGPRNFYKALHTFSSLNLMNLIYIRNSHYTFSFNIIQLICNSNSTPGFWSI